jgi:sulfite exporter TauE/SafE
MSTWLDSFVFGAANSVHCACMCGPLALAFGRGAASVGAYQVARVASYTVLGGALGAIGRAAGSDRLATPGAWVAFVLAAGLLVLALSGSRGAVAIPGVGAALQRVTARTRTWSPAARAAALGAVTPLLPCGLLWAACTGAAVAGTAVGGGAVLGAFALGALPLLVLAQTQVFALARRFGPRTLQLVQRGAMLLAAAALVWRGVLALHGSDCCGCGGGS